MLLRRFPRAIPEFFELDHPFYLGERIQIRIDDKRARLTHKKVFMVV
jgi:hypothetical protein